MQSNSSVVVVHFPKIFQLIKEWFITNLPKIRADPYSVSPPLLLLFMPGRGFLGMEGYMTPVRTSTQSCYTLMHAFPFLPMLTMCPHHLLTQIIHCLKNGSRSHHPLHAMRKATGAGQVNKIFHFKIIL
jgi:hypothetical protein